MMDDRDIPFICPTVLVVMSNLMDLIRKHGLRFEVNKPGKDEMFTELKKCKTLDMTDIFKDVPPPKLVNLKIKPEDDCPLERFSQWYSTRLRQSWW